MFKKSLIGILTLVLGFTMTIPANAATTNCLLPSSSGSQIVICNGTNDTNSLPDVIVTSLNYNQTTHNFTAVVKNQGTVAIPAGIFIGVGYSVDGLHKTWGIVKGPLAAGASVTIGTNTGSTAGPYTIASGTHSIKAWVDDVNRFAETNENINK
jgi:subtilase family serine protease